MSRNSAKFLQVLIMLVGIGVLALMLWEPHLEGRNSHATPFEIYFNDPFLAFAYVASIPFFVALYQAFKVFARAGRNELFSRDNVKALRTIKYCALSLIAFVAAGEVFILSQESDDRAGGVFMGILIASASIAIVVGAATFERLLRNAIGKNMGST